MKKSIFWIGSAVLLLGLASLIVSIPRTERDSVQAAGISIGVETRHQETILPVISALIILGGAGMMVAGQLKRQ